MISRKNFNPGEFDRAEYLSEKNAQTTAFNGDAGNLNNDNDNVMIVKSEVDEEISRYTDVSKTRHWVFTFAKWLLCAMFVLSVILVYGLPLLFLVWHLNEILSMPIESVLVLFKNKFIWVLPIIYMSFPLCILTATMKYSHIEEVAKAGKGLADFDIGETIGRAISVFVARGKS